MAANTRTTFSQGFFLNENFGISIRILLKFVPTYPTNNKSVLVQVMPWYLTGNKPLPEPMLTQFTSQVDHQK